MSTPTSTTTMRTTSTTLQHVHETPLALPTVEMSPPHPPRTETPEYRRAHDFLITTKNSPCQACGVTKRTLRNREKNPWGAKQLETHHYPVERSLVDACDPVRVHADFPQVYDRATLLQFVDSPANLIVLCDYHHRSLAAGIHHLPVQDFVIQKYLLAGYQVVANAHDAATIEAADERIMRADGVEAAVSVSEHVPAPLSGALVSPGVPSGSPVAQTSTAPTGCQLAQHHATVRPPSRPSSAKRPVASAPRSRATRAAHVHA